jgi:DNA-binding MarR family transcriptional regulator
VTELFLLIFRVHSLMLLRGNELVRPLNISGRGWQVLASIRDTPHTMAQISRRMGITRQGVRQAIERLSRSGMVEMTVNPDHARAQLIKLTPQGKKLLKQAESLQANWCNAVGAQIDPSKLAAGYQALGKLRSILEWRGPGRAASAGRKGKPKGSRGQEDTGLSHLARG